MYNTLFDFIENKPATIVAGMVPYYDGCYRTLVELPVNGINTGDDVRSFIDCGYIMSQLANTASVSKAGCGFDVNVSWLNSQVFSNRSCPLLTIGSTAHNLSGILNQFGFTITDGGNNTSVGNGDILLFSGLDGLRATVNAGSVRFGLPTTNRQANYVLTWNGTTATRAPSCDACCSQIQDCMRPITDSLQGQINSILTLIAGSAAPSTEDFTVAASFNSGTGIATFTRVLGGTYTLDLSSLNEDDYTVGASLTGSTLTFTRVLGGTYNVSLASIASDTFVASGTLLPGGTLRLTRTDLANVDIDVSSLVITQEQVQDWTAPLFTSGGHTGISFVYNDASNRIEATVTALPLSGQEEGVTVQTGVGVVNFIGAGVTATAGGAGVLNVTIPGAIAGTDELVKITAGDTGPNYLDASMANTTTIVVTNDGTIQKRVVGAPGTDQTLMLSVNLATYTGNTNFIGNHTQTGNETITGTTNLQGPVNIGAGPLTYTATVTTGTQLFDTNYIGTYDSAIINYNNGTAVNQSTNSIYNNNGTSNFSDESQFNFAGDMNFLAGNETTGTQNFLATYVGNYADNSILNIAGDVNRGATSVQNYTAGSTVGGAVNYTNLIITGTNVDATYDSASSMTYNGSTINNNGITTNNTGVTANNYSATYVGNNVYNAAAVTNTTGGTHNHIGGTYNYGATSVFNHAGDVNLTGTTSITTLEVTNLTQGGVPINGLARQTASITGDNVTVTFPLGFTPISEDYIDVSNGSSLYMKGVDYNVSGSNITFASAPATGENVFVKGFVSMGPIFNPSFGAVNSGTFTIPNTATFDTITITHNLGVTSADVYAGRYSIIFSYRIGADLASSYGRNSAGSVVNYTSNPTRLDNVIHKFINANPASLWESNRQANTVKIGVTGLLNFGNYVDPTVRYTIVQNR